MNIHGIRAMEELRDRHGLKESKAGTLMFDSFCPAHEDSKPSLHSTILFDDQQSPYSVHTCKAGCETENVLKAMGLKFSDCYPLKPAGNSHSSPAGKKRGDEPQKNRKVACTYDYPDANGVVQHQTVRWEPKGFTQRRRAEPNQTYFIGGKEYKSFTDPFGNSWINTLKGIEPVIYNLPEILKADPKQIIVGCEGEKDANRLRDDFGFLTTTVPMGAGQWRPSYTETFRGRRFGYVPDTDKPRKGQTDPAANAGFDGARKIAAELVGVAAEVRIVYLPDLGKLKPKWDVSDWIDAGGTKKQFFKAWTEAPILTAGHPGLIPAGITSADAALAPSSSAGKESVASAQSQQIANIIETSDGFDPLPMPVSGRLKPATERRFKTSHYES